MTRYFKKYSLHYRSLLAMGVPIMVGQLGVILTGFVDNIMVGHHTTAELSAASFVNNIFMLPLMFATGFAMGITPLIGEQTGRNELPQAGQIFRYGLFANGILAASLILIMGTLYFFLDRMGLPQELLPLMRPYYLLHLIGLVPVLLFNAFKQFADGTTDTLTPMFILLSSNLLNIIGNTVLIYGYAGFPEWGLFGAGVSTLTARIFTIVAGGQLKVQRFLHAVGALPVAFPAGVCRPQRLPIPEVELPAGAGHLVRADVLLTPQAALGVIDQQPGPVTARFRAGNVQIVAAVQRTAHRLLHIGKAACVQHTGNFCGDAAVPGHHAVGREIIKRLVDDAEAPGSALCHAPAAQAAELEIRGLGAVELVQGVFLEEQRIAHAGGRAGERPVAAHGDGIAVRRDAPVAEPVGGVAQAAGVDDVFLVAAAPHPVVALGDVIEVRHPALHAHRAFQRDAARLAAVQAGPQRTVCPLHQRAVKAVAARRHPHPQGIFFHVVHHKVAIQFFPHASLLRSGARHGHGVPLGKQLLRARRRDAAVFQRDGGPAAGNCAVHFQRAGAAPGVCLILHL